MLPDRLVEPLAAHLRFRRAAFEKDRAVVHVPNAIDRKYPSAPASWTWQ